MNKEEMFEDLRTRILSGDLVPGDWLVERELSELYGNSRTPIREILRKLAHLGIVELQPSKGYQVKRLSIEEIVEIFHAREAVEGEGARLACLVDSDELIEASRELHERLLAVDISTDTAKGLAIGKQLHDLVMKAANNRYLTEFYEKLRNLAALTRNMSRNSPHIEEKSKNDHLAILSALSERDAKKSERLMKEHLRATCKALVRNHLNVTDGFCLGLGRRTDRADFRG